jgi:hypothetical protein
MIKNRNQRILKLSLAMKRSEWFTGLWMITYQISSGFSFLMTILGLCYFLRKHIELSLGLTASKFDGEMDVIMGYADNTLRLAIPKSNIFLNRGRCPAADYFYSYAPTPIR